MAVLAVVALILGLFVVRPILVSNAQSAPVALIGPDGQQRAGLPGTSSEYAIGEVGNSTQITSNTALPNTSTQTNAIAGSPASSRGSTEVLTGEIDDGTGEMPDLAVMSPDEIRAASQSQLFDEDGQEITDPVERLRKLIEERREETVEILRNWMEDSEEPVQ